MSQCTHNCNQGRSCTCVITDVSLPNTEAIRKENEQLRERITEIERISYSARCALQADVNDRDEVIANCSDKIRILESKLAALKGGAA